MNSMLAPEQIPWYRTRLFWGVVIGILAVWGLFFYLFLLPPATTLMGVLDNASYALGATLFGLSGFKLAGPTGSTAGVVLYFILLTILTSKTFSKTQVDILFPIALVILFLLGSFVGIGYLSGL